MKYLFMPYQLATVGLLDASLHACDETCLVFKHAMNRLFHQFLRILAICRGHLSEPSFNIVRKTCFHIPTVSMRAICVKHVGARH